MEEEYELAYSTIDEEDSDCDYEDDWYDPDVCDACGSYRCSTCGEMTCFGCSCDDELEEFEYVCNDCGEKFDEPLVVEEEVFIYEYWGEHGTKKEYVSKCPACESDDFSSLF